MLTSKQRAYLRGLGQSCPAIMQVGKGGISENLIKTVSDALEARELVKLTVLENSGEDPRAMLDALCEALSYVSFIFTDSSSAEIFLKEPTFDPEEILRTIHKRFGVLSVILTDEGLAFDGERITEFTEE